MKKIISGRFVAMLAAPLLLSACGAGGVAGVPSGSSRADVAQTLAQQGMLTRADIVAGQFTLASWRRIGAPGQPAQVYIEGDGLAWLSRGTPSGNPTPKNPIALALAKQDRSANVIYIARPCQYTDVGTTCPQEYWMGKRFAPEVIESFDAALTKLAQETGVNGFHLIGYSGGGNIAGLIAERRSDILSLRTVAGNLDNDYFTKMHNVSDMPYSLNMAEEANAVSTLPQLHFIGGHDEFVPQSVYDSYRTKITTPTSCIRYKVLQDYDHMEGWVDAWPSLLKLPVNCHP